MPDTLYDYVLTLTADGVVDDDLVLVRSDLLLVEFHLMLGRLVKGSYSYHMGLIVIMQ